MPETQRSAWGGRKPSVMAQQFANLISGRHFPVLPPKELNLQENHSPAIDNRVLGGQVALAT